VSARIEQFLARLYTDADLRSRFLAQPAQIARAAGLDEPSVAALARIDRVGLELAADSYARKREQHRRRK
jgi:hypothetical protein